MSSGVLVLTQDVRCIITNRARGVILTDDFNNQYQDILKTWKTWKMYDWLTWADVWAGFLLKDLDLHGQLPDETECYRQPRHCPVSQSFTELVHRFHK